MSDESQPDSLETSALQGSERLPTARGATLPPDLETLREMDCTRTDLVRPTLAALLASHADRFSPARFYFIAALAEKASKQRSGVAEVLEQKALRALCDYLDAYVPAREHAASLVAQVASNAPEDADQAGRLLAAGDFAGVEQLAARSGRENKQEPGALTVLAREMQQPVGSSEFARNSAFDEELQQQEREFMLSVAGAMTGDASGTGAEQEQNPFHELKAMRYFRESLVQHNSEKRVARAVKDGPENPGPLNAHALMVSSLSMMRDISPVYTNRLLSYMETLFWLEQAGAAVAPAKSKGSGRRKSRND